MSLSVLFIVFVVYAPRLHPQQRKKEPSREEGRKTKEESSQGKDVKHRMKSRGMRKACKKIFISA